MGQRYPAAFPAGAVTPIWVRALQVIGGVKGDDVSASTAALVTDQIAANGPNTAVDYSPRNQSQKATALSKTIAADVTRKRGNIAPTDRYPVASDAAVAAPTLTGISPNTGVAGGSDVIVRLTGTGFTGWSDVVVGGVAAPYRYMTYVSPTAIDVVMDCKRSVAGSATIQVIDHGVLTASQTFTFT